MRRYTFRRKQRLRLRDDFRRVVRTACSAADRRLVVYVAANDVGCARLGTSVGKRIGPAVERNRVKRLIREAFRLLQYELPSGLDLLVIPRGTEPPTLEGYRRSLLALSRRAACKLAKRGETPTP